MILTETIKNQFGSKRGLLSLVVAKIAYHLGYYNDMKKIDFKKITRLIFVCSGNICRSPLGEAVAISRGMAAISFGLDTRGGDNADPRAIAYCENIGINLTKHKTCRIDQYVPANGDLLVGMEPKHTKALRRLYGNQIQMTVLGLWLNKPVVYLHDPYNTNSVFFNHCESLVEQATILLTAKALTHINEK